jgi:hypothetical protein
MRRILVAAVLALAACQSPTEEPQPEPAPAAVPHGPATEAPHSCEVLGVGAVGEVVGDEVEEIDATAGETLNLCTYELPDGFGTVDIAVVNLHALAAQGERVTPNAYIGQLRDGAGQGEVQNLAGVGDGDALSIAYELGSQAWAFQGMLVVGAYATNVLEPTELAARLLEAALDAL